MTDAEYERMMERADRKASGATRRDRIAPVNRGARPDGRFREAFASPKAGRSSVHRSSSGTPGIAPAAPNDDNRGQDFRTLDQSLAELRKTPDSSVARWRAV